MSDEFDTVVTSGPITELPVSARSPGPVTKTLPETPLLPDDDDRHKVAERIWEMYRKTYERDDRERARRKREGLTTKGEGDSARQTLKRRQPR